MTLKGTHRALCLTSCARQERLPLSKAASWWQRPHCWQKRCIVPWRMNDGSLMCTSQMRQRWWYVVRPPRSRPQSSTCVESEPADLEAPEDIRTCASEAAAKAASSH